MEVILSDDSEAIIYEVTSSPSSSVFNSTEFDLGAFLKTHLGSRNRDFSGSLTLTVVYCVIFVTGLLGNVCTCVVIATNAHLHTATNFYLFSLAISDLFTLILGQCYNTRILLHCRCHTTLHKTSLAQLVAVITCIIDLP